MSSARLTGKKNNTMDTLIIKKEKQINAHTSKVWSILTDAASIEKAIGHPIAKLHFHLPGKARNMLTEGRSSSLRRRKFSHTAIGVFFRAYPTNRRIILKLNSNYIRMTRQRSFN